MKITRLKTWQVPPRWLFLKIKTDEDCYGGGSRSSRAESSPSRPPPMSSPTTWWAMALAISSIGGTPCIGSARKAFVVDQADASVFCDVMETKYANRPLLIPCDIRVNFLLPSWVMTGQPLTIDGGRS